LSDGGQAGVRSPVIVLSAGQVWSVSSLWIVPIVGWHHFVTGGRRVVPPDICDTEYATNTALKIVTSILNYYLPLALMYALYTKIFVEASTFDLTALTTFTQQCIAPADGVHSVNAYKGFLPQH